MATTSRQVHLLIASEVLLVTGVAATLGLIPGYILTSLLRRAFASGGAIPSDFGLVYSPLPAVAGVVLPVATASVAAWLVARRPARARPVEALAEASVEPTRLHPARLGCGWVLAGIGVATSLMPLILPGELAVSLATVQLFTQSTLSATAAEQADMGVTADFIVTGTRTGLAPSVARAVAAVPGVDTVAPIVRSQVLISYTELGDPTAAPFTAQGILPGAINHTLNLDVRSGNLDLLTGNNTVALDHLTAQTIGAEPGDTIEFHLGDGTPLRPQVVGVYGRGLGFGAVSLPHDLLISHVTDQADTAILVDAADDTDQAAVPARLGSMADESPGMIVLDGDQLAAAGQAERQLGVVDAPRPRSGTSTDEGVELLLREAAVRLQGGCVG